jgi:hypothetical protein
VSLHKCAFVASVLVLAAICFAAIVASESPEVEPMTPQTVSPGAVEYQPRSLP